MDIIAALHLDWPNLIGGFLLGSTGAYAAHILYDRRQTAALASRLRKRYGKLARAYSNYRPDGSATGGSVQLTQKPDGSFEIVGLNLDRTVDWESVLRMDEKIENLGTAYYRYKPGKNHGVQYIRYAPETDELHVKGVRQSAGPPLEFHHIWRPKS
jgi:hypothetical protein